MYMLLGKLNEVDPISGELVQVIDSFNNWKTAEEYGDYLLSYHDIEWYQVVSEDNNAVLVSSHYGPKGIEKSYPKVKAAVKL